MMTKSLSISQTKEVSMVESILLRGKANKLPLEALSSTISCTNKLSHHPRLPVNLLFYVHTRIKLVQTAGEFLDQKYSPRWIMDTQGEIAIFLSILELLENN